MRVNGINTSGNLRVIAINGDGCFVVGEGYMIPVDDASEGQQLIAEIKAERRNADHIDGYDRDDLGESPDY